MFPGVGFSKPSFITLAGDTFGLVLRGVLAAM
jgi:hypothetical protein